MMLFHKWIVAANLRSDERREITISDDDDNVDDDETLLSIWFVFAIKTRSEFEKSKLLICLLENGADTSFIIC